VVDAPVGGFPDRGTFPVSLNRAGENRTDWHFLLSGNSSSRPLRIVALLFKQREILRRITQSVTVFAAVVIEGAAAWEHEKRRRPRAN
jgi:hypothetical protein